MKKGIIAIIEGTSCVGKTTLCQSLESEGWIILPEAIRYLEREKRQNPNEEETQGADSEEEELRTQDKFLRIEMKKIIYANLLSKRGLNVVLDKSFIATVATAYAFQMQKGFNGTYKKAREKYIQMQEKLKNNGLIECDVFLLLTADYKTIIERNRGRKHVLNGIWTDENTINNQRTALEDMTTKLVGNSGSPVRVKRTLDTTFLDKAQVMDEFHKIIEGLDKSGPEL